ncbi:MAG: hypothetical protein Q9M34_06780, partial [Sulfurimonas sp.]|nr:hypothetical protein [Sulfurimonas sp.]
PMDMNTTVPMDMNTTVPTTTVVSFATDVMPVLETDCKSCHGTSGAFTITTATATYANIASFSGIDIANPTNSRLLTKANGVGHGGGLRWNTTDASYITVKDWITQGALNN